MLSFSFVLVGLALVCVQVLIGGVRPVFSLPGYLLLAAGAITALMAGRKMVRPPILCVGASLLLAGWVIGRALTSPVPYLARPDLLMTMAALLVYLLTVTSYATLRMRQALVSVFVILALVHVGIGAVQFKQADEFMLLPGIFRPHIYEWRASGFYICPNHLAGLLEMVGMLGLAFACWGSHRPRLKVLAGYAAAMCVVGLALTGSRGGYLSVVFGLGAFALLSLWVVQLTRRGGFWLTFAALLVSACVVVGGALFVMWQSDTLRNRLGMIYEPNNPRLFLWKAALMQHHLQPVTGTGAGTYLYYGRQFRAAPVQNDPMHVHDDYLELLAEYGIVGVALGGLFLVVHLISGLVGVRRIVREQILPGMPRASNDLALTVGALAAIAALLLHSVVDFNAHIPGNALLIAFLFGLLARPVSEQLLVAPQKWTAAGWWRWLGMALALVLLVLSGRLWPGEIYAEKARVALRDGRFAEALEFAQRGIAWDKRNPVLYQHLGDARHFLTLQAANRAEAQALHEDALTAYEAGLKLFPQDTGLLLKEAQVLDLLERYAGAEEVFQQLLQDDPFFGNVYAYYGLHWELQKRMAAAEQCFRAAKSLGEEEISLKGLARIEQMKASPLGQGLIDTFSGQRLDLPADRLPPPP